MKIIISICEVTNNKYITLVKTIHDDLIKLHPYYSDIEKQYFQTIFQEILGKQNYEILINECLNLSSTFHSISIQRAQTLLNKWIMDGYFVKNENRVYFGIRTISEFNELFRNNYADQISICILCQELIFNVRRIFYVVLSCF